MTKPGPAQIGEHNRKQNSDIICLQKILLKVRDTGNFKVTGYTKIYPADTNQKWHTYVHIWGNYTLPWKVLLDIKD